MNLIIIALLLQIRADQIRKQNAQNAWWLDMASVVVFVAVIITSIFTFIN